MDNCKVSSKQRDSSPPKNISVIIYSPSCCSEPDFLLFVEHKDILGNLGEFFVNTKLLMMIQTSFKTSFEVI